MNALLLSHLVMYSHSGICFRPLLLSSSIFPEDERSVTVCKSILECIKEKALLLDQWRAIHEEMFGTDHDIPSSESMGLVKLDGASFNADTCNAARSTSRRTMEAVEEVVKETILIEEGVERDVLLLQQDCHHHMRNVWMGAIVRHLSKYLDNLLDSDLASISFRYRVTTMMDGVLRAIDKEFSLPANYPKGHGDWFKYWLKKMHPGALQLAVERATGSRMDLACEGAGAVYWNRK